MCTKTEKIYILVKNDTVRCPPSPPLTFPLLSVIYWMFLHPTQPRLQNGPGQVTERTFNTSSLTVFLLISQHTVVLQFKYVTWNGGFYPRFPGIMNWK